MLGCLVRLALLAFTVTVFYLLFSLQAPFPTLDFSQDGIAAAAFLAGFFTWFAVMAWLARRRMAQEVIRTGNYSFKDGAKATVAGTIEAKELTAPLLTAPFSGVQCLAYRYIISHYTFIGGSINTGKWWIDYEGYALVPSVVRGPSGRINILAEPDSEFFHEVPCRKLSNNDDWIRADEFIRKTDFGEDHGLLEIKKERLIYDRPGSFRKDLQCGEPIENLIERPRVLENGVIKRKATVIKEAVIKSGDSVLISGVYSADQNGIRPDPDTIINPFHLIIGGTDTIKKKMRNRTVCMLVSALLTLSVCALYYTGIFR